MGDEIPEVPDPAPSVEATLIVAGKTRQLRECLARLDARQQHAIRSAFFDGITYAELANKTDVPLATAKSRVRRGLIYLRRCLDEGDPIGYGSSTVSGTGKLSIRKKY